MDFLISYKPFFMDKTITVGQKWLFNELVILVKVIAVTDDDDDNDNDNRHTLS